MAVNVGNGYITVYPKLDGKFGSSIKSQMQGEVDGQSMGSAIGGKLSAGFAAKMGAVAGLAQSAIQGAVTAVGNSLGAAVSRVDTMAAFPRVMENLGYSASDAETQIGRMSDRLQNLPTTLPAMTSMVQQLAPMTSGLQEATDLGLAFNDMLVAGRQGAEMQSAAMVQYTQMLAKGKPELQDWRSLQMAMPGQLDQVSKALLGTSARSNDLYDALQSGSVTMGDFNAAIMNLDQNGANGFASFAKQAEDATGGIETKLSNTRNAIVKNLGNVIKELSPQINGGLDLIKGAVNTAGGVVVGFVTGLSSSIDFSGFESACKGVSDAVGLAFPSDGGGAEGFGQAVGGAVNGLIPIIQAVTPFIQASADALKLLSDNASWAVPLILTLAVGMKAVQTASGMSKALSDVGNSVAKISEHAASAGMDLLITATGEEAAGTAGGASAKQILAAAVAVVALGTGVALASAGMWIIAHAAIGIASAGPGAAVAMLLMVAGIAGLAIGAAILGPALTAGAVGMLAFGAAVLMVGAGIALASLGIVLVAQQLPVIADSGAGAAAGLLMVAAAMLGLSAGALVGDAVLAPFAAIALLCGAACLVLGAGALMAGAGVTVLADGTMLLATSVMLMAAAIGAATAAGEGAFNALGDTVSSVMNGARDTVSGIVDAIKGFFNFDLSFPELQLPHIEYTLIDVPVLGSIPDPTTFHIEWYAQGALFAPHSPTVAGIGEGRYPETALPLSPRVLSGIGDGIADHMDFTGAKGGDTYIVEGITYDDSSSVAKTVNDLVRKTKRINRMKG